MSAILKSVYVFAVVYAGLAMPRQWHFVVVWVLCCLFTLAVLAVEDLGATRKSEGQNHA